MSIQPTATIRLGNLQYTQQAISVSATLATLPALNSFTVTLPAGLRLEAQPDDAGVLEMDSGDAAGAGAATIITGKVRSIRRALRTVAVTVGDAGAELARLRPGATYEKQNAQEVIRALAGEASVAVDGLDIDLPLASYTAHQGRTAAELVSSLARLGGCLASVNSSGQLSVAAWPEGQPEQALKYGREILEYDLREVPGPAARHLMIGQGTAGSTSSPDALRPSLTHLPEDAPPPGASAIWTAVGALRVPAAAATASAGANAVAGSYAKQVRARSFLLPGLRPGMVIQVQDLPDGLSGGPWIVLRVRHQLRPHQGGVTTFEGVSGAGGGLAGPLASALSAAGGLV
jgi:hypothetical protein